MEKILEVKNLSVSFDSPKGEVQAVRDVSFSLKKGEVLAIVGESGCREKCVMQKYYEASSQKCKDKRGKYLGEWSGYYRI